MRRATAPILKKVFIRASKRRSLFVQQESFLRNPTSAFLANKQVSCGIQQVSCGMRVALLILMAVKLLIRTGCKITARCSHGVNRRSGTPTRSRMLRVPPRSSSPYRLAHHMRTLPPGHRPGVELFWRKLILEEIKRCYPPLPRPRVDRFQAHSWPV